MLNRKLFIILHAIAGIYAGACVSIAIVDLRFVKSIESTLQAKSTFAQLLVNMGQLMLPQLLILLLLCIYFSVRAIKRKSKLSTHAPLFVLILILAITLSIHIPINQDFISDNIQQEKIYELILKWDLWHWIRTALSLILPGLIVKYYRPLSGKTS